MMTSTKGPEGQNKPYTVIREADFYDRLFWTYYRLGMQSNVIVAAEYNHPEHSTLNRNTVAAALCEVVKAQPRLRHVIVPKLRKKGQTILNVCILNEIDINSCIEFIDVEDEKDDNAQLIEQLHNQWFAWAEDDPNGPSWKLVIKGRHVLFVYSHAVADGTSGYVFHREFLAALNALSSPGDEAYAVSPLQATEQDLSAGSIQLASLLVLPGPSIITLIWRALYYFVIGMVYGGRRLNDDYPASKPYHTDLIKHPSAENRVQVRVLARRIPASDASHILSVCRANGATLTPLIAVLYLATMAMDQFPNAVMSTPSIPYDMRQYLPMDRFQQGSSPRGAGVIMNGAGGAQWPLWLSSVRELFPGGEVDPSAFWSYVSGFRKTLKERMEGEASKVFVAPQLLGDTLEDILKSVFPKMDTHHNNLVSNLGAFSPIQDSETNGAGKWQIADVVFSVPNTNGNVGPHGVILSVAGTKGGDLNIYASSERDVVSQEQAEQLLDGIVRRMYQVTSVEKS